MATRRGEDVGEGAMITGEGRGEVSDSNLKGSYKKLKEECFSSLSKNYEAAEEPLLRPAIPSASREALVPERAYLRTYASVSVEAFIAGGGLLVVDVRISTLAT